MGSGASRSRVEPADRAFVHLRNLKKGVSLASAMAAPKKVQFSTAPCDGAAYLAPVDATCPTSSALREHPRSGERRREYVRRLSSAAIVDGESPLIEPSETSTAVNNGMAPYRLFRPEAVPTFRPEASWLEHREDSQGRLRTMADKNRRASLEKHSSSRAQPSSVLRLGARHVW